MAKHVELAPDPDFHVMEALGYVNGLSTMAAAASEEKIDITGFEMMMLLAPVIELLKRTEKDLKQA